MNNICSSKQRLFEWTNAQWVYHNVTFIKTAQKNRLRK